MVQERVEAAREPGAATPIAMSVRRELSRARHKGNDSLHHPYQNLNLVHQAEERLSGDERLSSSHPGRAITLGQ